MSFWRKSLWYSLLMVVQAASLRVCGVLANGLLARILVPSDWGSLQAVNAVAATLAQTLKLSLDGALQVRISETVADSAAHDRRNQALGAATVLIALVSVGALVLGFGFAAPAAGLFGDRSLARWMGFAGVLAASQLALQMCAVLVGLGAFRLFASINVCLAVANLALLAAMYLLGARGLQVALVMTVATQAATALATVLFAVRTWRRHGLQPRLDRLGSATRELLRLGLPLYFASAVPSAVWLLLNAKLARVSGVESLAALRIVAMVNQVVAFAPAAVAQTFITQFAAARASSAQVPAADFMRYLRVVVASALMTALAAAIIKQYLVRVAFGSQYEWTVPLVDLGLITAIISTIKQAQLVGLISERRTEYALVEAVCSTLTGALLGQLLIPRWHVAGFLIAELLGQLISAALLFGLVARRLSDATDSRTLAAVGGSLTCAIGILAFSHAVHRGGHPYGWQLSAVLSVLIVALPFVLFTRGERSAALRELLNARQRWRP